MSFRREFISDVKIGDGLEGDSCAHGTEQGLCAAIARRGLQVHFVRDAWVLHYCAPRQANEARTDHSSKWALTTTRNMAYVLWRYQPLWTALRVFLWSTLIGSRKNPGILLAMFAPSFLGLAARHCQVALNGASKGLHDRGQPSIKP
jgi:hypothetical protein